MLIKLAYGKSFVPLDVPEDNVIKILRRGNQFPLPRPESAVREVLENPIGTAPLIELAAGRKTAGIVVSDITRPAPNILILPIILDTLHKAGLKPEDITIFIATGIHRPCLGDEQIELLGRDIVRKYRIENNQPRDKSKYKKLDETEEGIPVLIYKPFLECDLKILTGLINPHMLAGFSGGRKSVLPGMAHADTMSLMHGFQMVESDATTYGRIKDNPFHLAATKVARMADMDFIVNTVTDDNNNTCAVFAGDLEEAFLAGTDVARKNVFDTMPEEADIAVTCAGGYPLDRTLYQSIKGLVVCKPFTKKGGTMIIASDCGEGVGGADFSAQLREMKSPDAFLEMVNAPDYFRIDQWMVQEICYLLKNWNILWYAGDSVRDWPDNIFKRVPSLDDGLAEAFRRHGPSAKIAVLPSGPYVMAELK